MEINIPDKMEEVPLSSVALYSKSLLEHTDEQLDKIINSIKNYGQTNPILIDRQGRVITGGAVYICCD